MTYRYLSLSLNKVRLEKKSIKIKFIIFFTFQPSPTETRCRRTWARRRISRRIPKSVRKSMPNVSTTKLETTRSGLHYAFTHYASRLLSKLTLTSIKISLNHTVTVNHTVKLGYIIKVIANSCYLRKKSPMKFGIDEFLRWFMLNYCQ